jgi:cell division transport system permease protein
MIAWVLITSVQMFLANLLTTGPDFIQYIASGAQPNPIQILLLPVLLLSLGGSVGLMGSLFAVRRFASR